MSDTILPPLIQWTRSIAAAFGPAPRRTTWFLKSQFKTPRPPWCIPGDPLLLVQQEKRRLLTQGRVVFAYVLRHDSVLDQRGPVHGSADLLYPLDDSHVVLPEQLATVGERLSSLRYQAELTDSERRFASFLSAGNQRGFGVRTPESVSDGCETAVSSMIVYRHFLPGSVLSRRMIPIVVATDSPRVALPIPKAYWPDEMYDWWLAGSV